MLSILTDDCSCYFVLEQALYPSPFWYFIDLLFLDLAFSRIVLPTQPPIYFVRGVWNRMSESGCLCECSTGLIKREISAMLAEIKGNPLADI
jgi:hypothetical protein